MSSDLAVEEVRGNRHVGVGTLNGDNATVGRDKECTLILSSGSVSWQHGMFIRARDHWLYKDVGSTNGSWLNGIQLNKEQWTLVRAGDVLQLADTALTLKQISSGQKDAFPQPRSLLVFSRGSFQEEYQIPEYGRALVIGGAKADLRLDVDINELPSLVIERRGDRVCAFSIAREAPIRHNGKEISNLVNLNDRDELRIGHYIILLNEPDSGASTQERPRLQDWSSSPRASEPAAPSAEGDAAPNESRVDLRVQPRATSHLPFGKTPDEQEFDAYETVALDPAEVREKLSGYEMHPSMRYTTPEEQSGGFALDSVEDKIMFLVGLVLFVALMGVVLWWVFFV